MKGEAEMIKTEFLSAGEARKALLLRISDLIGGAQALTALDSQTREH